MNLGLVIKGQPTYLTHVKADALPPIGSVLRFEGQTYRVLGYEFNAQKKAKGLALVAIVVVERLDKDQTPVPNFERYTDKKS